MSTRTEVKSWKVAVALALFAATSASCSLAQPAPQESKERVSNRYPAGSIRSVAEADAALAAAAAERAGIEARYMTEEQACHPKFFTTSCIEQAKERRRVAISALRPVEIEANAFKRQTRVAERDRALAERLEKDEGERQERASRLSPDQAATSATVPHEPARGEQAPPNVTREIESEATANRPKVGEGISAEKRAANIAAYEKKRRDALERQKTVAQRKAEKEQKRNAKQAENGKSD